VDLWAVPEEWARVAVMVAAAVMDPRAAVMVVVHAAVMAVDAAVTAVVRAATAVDPAATAAVLGVMVGVAAPPTHRRAVRAAMAVDQPATVISPTITATIEGGRVVVPVLSVAVISTADAHQPGGATVEHPSAPEWDTPGAPAHLVMDPAPRRVMVMVARIIEH